MHDPAAAARYTVLIDAEQHGAAIDEVIADGDGTAIAAITVAELQVGASLADGSRRTTRQAFIDAVVATVPIVPHDLSVAKAHAGLLVATRKAGRSCGAHDLIISSQPPRSPAGARSSPPIQPA